MKKQIVIAGVLALLIYPSFGTPATANPIAAPACRDVPSCVVTGTIVIGGVVYYLIRNTVTGVVHRVPAPQMPPAHRTIENDPYPVGSSFPIPGNVTRAKCEQKAREIQEQFGGEWTIEEWH